MQELAAAGYHAVSFASTKLRRFAAALNRWSPVYATPIVSKRSLSLLSQWYGVAVGQKLIKPLAVSLVLNRSAGREVARGLLTVRKP